MSLPLADADGQARFVLAYNRPISFRHELLANIMGATVDAIIGLGEVVNDAHSIGYTVISLNAAARAMLGGDTNIIGQRLDTVAVGNSQPLAREDDVEAALSKAVATEDRVFHSDHGDEWYRIAIRHFDHGAVMTLANLTAFKQSEHKLKQLASTDPLTAAPHRRYFLDQLTKEIARSERSDTCLSFAMIDSDRFKRVNDTLGHRCWQRSFNPTG